VLSQILPLSLKYKKTVFRFWSRMIRMFLGLWNPDPLVIDPDPSITEQKLKISFYHICT
jgi:hypothetical protein